MVYSMCFNITISEVNIVFWLDGLAQKKAYINGKIIAFVDMDFFIYIAIICAGSLT